MTDIESNLKQLMAMDSCWLLDVLDRISKVSITRYRVITFEEKDDSRNSIIVTFRHSPIGVPRRQFLMRGRYEFFATKEEAEQEIVLRKLTGNTSPGERNMKPTGPPPPPKPKKVFRK